MTEAQATTPALSDAERIARLEADLAELRAAQAPAPAPEPEKPRETVETLIEARVSPEQFRDRFKGKANAAALDAIVKMYAGKYRARWGA